MNRAERLAAVAVAAYAATRWAQTSPRTRRAAMRVKVATTALRGGTVVYRASIERGTLVIKNRRHAVVADSAFIGFPHVDLTCQQCGGDGEYRCPPEIECDGHHCSRCDGTGRRLPTLNEWDAVQPGPAIWAAAGTGGTT